MSTLAAQLNRISSSNPLAVKAIKYQPSFLFDEKEASDMNLEMIYAIGLNGLRALIGIDPGFSKFQETLFSHSAISFDRSFKTKEENKVLDDNIMDFLIVLQPYILMKASIKCLEWLLRRFYINEFNVNQLLCCLLPYHDQSIFLKAIQLCNLEKSHWTFLEDKPYASKEMLIQQFKKDPSIIVMICDMISYCSDNEVSPQLMKIRSALYLSMIVPYLKSVVVNENVLLRILPSLMACLKAKSSQEMQLSAYMIIAEIADSTILSEKMCSVLISSVALAAHDFEKSLMCLIKICQTQENVSTIGLSVIKKIISNVQLPDILKHLSINYDCSRFLIILGQSLYEKLEIGDLNHLQSILGKVNIPAECENHLIKSLIKLNETAHENEKKLINSIIHKLHYEESALAEAGSKNTDFKVIDVNLILQLRSPNVKIRENAVKAFVSNIEKADNSLNDVLLNCLDDDSNIVLRHILEFPLLSACISDSRVLFSKLLIILKQEDIEVEVKQLALKSTFSIMKGSDGLRQVIKLAPFFIGHKLSNSVIMGLNEYFFSLPTSLVNFENVMQKMAEEMNQLNDKQMIVENLQDLIQKCACLSSKAFLLILMLNIISLDISKSQEYLRVCLWLMEIIIKLPIAHSENIKQSLSTGDLNAAGLYCMEKLLHILATITKKTDFNISEVENSVHHRINEKFFEYCINNLDICKRLIQYWMTKCFKSPIILLEFLIKTGIYAQDDLISIAAVQIGLAVFRKNMDENTLGVIFLGITCDKMVIREMLVNELLRHKLVFPENLHCTQESTLDLIKKRKFDIIKEKDAFSKGISTHLMKKKDLKMINFWVNLFDRLSDHDLKTLALEFIGSNKKIIPSLVRIVQETLNSVNGDLSMSRTRLLKAIFCLVGKCPQKLFTDDVIQNYLKLISELCQDSCSRYGAIINSFFENIIQILKSANSLKILDGLLSGAGYNGEYAPYCKKVLVQVPVSVEVFLRKFQEFIILFDNYEDTEISKKIKNGDGRDENHAIKQLECILEVLKTKGTKTPDNFKLIAPLFEILTIFSSNDSEDFHCSGDYTIQLALGILNDICSNYDSKDECVCEESLVRVDVLVQLIRQADNPESRNLSLKVLSSLSKLYPEKILRNIMPVFTFMGARILQKDDGSSFELTEKLIKAVVPIIIDCQNMQEFSPLLMNVLGVFCDAFFHIPEHRRMHLFCVLSKSVGPNNYLGIITAMLLSRSLRAYQQSEHRVLKDFLTAFLKKFNHEIGFQSLISLCSRMDNLINCISSNNMESEETRRLFGLVDFDGYEKLALDIGEFLMICTENPDFFAMDSEIDENIAKTLLNCTGSFINTLSNVQKAKNLNSRNRLMNLIMATVQNFASQVDQKIVMDIIITLLKNQDGKIRGNTLLILKTRLKSCSLEIISKVFSQLQDQLEIILQSTNEVDNNKNLSINCIETLVESIGSSNFDPKLMDLLVSAFKTCGSKENHHSSLLSCSIKFMEMYGAKILPALNFIVEIIITSKPANRHSSLRFKCLDSLMQLMPQFMSPYLLNVVLLLIEQKLDDTKSSSLMDSIEKSVTTKVDTRYILPVLYKAFEQEKTDASKTVGIIHMLQKVIEALNRENVVKYYRAMFKFMLEGFNLTVSKTETDNNIEVKPLQSALIECLTSLVLKLNESMFNPVFLKMIDWASAEVSTNVSITRKIILMEFTGTLFDKLTSIFAPYFINVIDCALRVIDSETDGFGYDNLWKATVYCLTQFFKYETDGNIAGEKVAEISKCIVPMLAFDSDKWKIDLKETAIPCIFQMAQFAITNNLDAVLKQINHDILMLTRRDSSRVKLASLASLELLYEKLGDELLVHLPETIPFIAELLEDDDESVEMATRKVIKLVETYLGESLEEHLQ